MSGKDDDDARARVKQMLEETRAACKPHVEAMVQGAIQTYTAAAQLAGDPITPENKGFWQIAGNIFFAANGKLDPTGPEVARLVDLSKAIATTTHYEDWAGAAGVCERLFDELEGGNELGLSDDFMSVEWHDEMQRSIALRKGMGFHRVPRAFKTAIGEVVARLMLATPDAWVMDDGHQLPQPWAQCCTYVVYAIAERVKATRGDRGYIPDGQHRMAG